MTGSKSSVSSACANIPLASAALTAEVLIFGREDGRLGDAALRAHVRMAISPGLRRAPDTIAPSVSRMRCLASRATCGGRARLAGFHHVARQPAGDVGSSISPGVARLPWVSEVVDASVLDAGKAAAQMIRPVLLNTRR